MNAPLACIGSIDLGSNSFHLQLALLRDGAPPLPTESWRAPVQLGKLEQGRIPERSAQAAIAALVDLVGQAQARGCEHLIAVGTAALRDAQNGPEVAQRLSQAAGVPVRILQGEDEARLIYLGAWTRTGRAGERLLVCDMGGRSTELAIGVDGRVLHGVSLPLGHLRQREAPARSPAQQADAALAPHREALRALGWDRVALTAGTGLTLIQMASMARGEAPSPSRHGLRATVPELRALHTLALGLPEPQRAALPGWDPRRAETLLYGGDVLLSLLEQLGVHEVLSSEAALREGLLEDWRQAQAAKAAPG